MASRRSFVGDYNPRTDHLFSAGLNNEFGITDQLKFITDLSYSQNKRTDGITEIYGLWRAAPIGDATRTTVTIA